MAEIQKSQAVTSAVQQAAAKAKLASPLAQHKAASGAGQVMGGLLIAAMSIFWFGMAGQLGDSAVSLVIWGCVFLGLGLFIAMLPAFDQPHAAYCYEHGFVYMEGGPLHAFRKAKRKKGLDGRKQVPEQLLSNAGGRSDASIVSFPADVPKSKVL